MQSRLRVSSPVAGEVEEGEARACIDTIRVGAMLLFSSEAKHGKASGGGMGANRGENEENAHASHNDEGGKTKTIE